MTVLIVDDDPVIQLVTTHVLATDGYTVHVAATGNEAVAIVQRENIDLVLLDLMLAEEDGLDVAERLREISNHFEIIVLSGRTDVAGDARLTSARVASVIHKPFDPAALSGRIRSILASS